MKRRPLPIMPTLAASYREWWRVVPALWPLLLNTWMILVAISAVENFVPMSLWNRIFLGETITIVRQAIQALLLAPIIIAIHRFVILNESSRVYTLPIGEPAFWRFFVWLFALGVLAGLPFDCLGVMETLGLSLGVSTLGFAVTLVAAIAMLLRLTILLPAIAVEAPGARPSQVLADTKSQSLRIFAIFCLAVLPWIVAGIGGILLLGRGTEVAGSTRSLINLVMGGVLQTILVSLMAVVASLLFIALAEQVRRALAVSQ